MFYFAYGSNMLTARLRERCPSARPMFLARLKNHALRFHKRSLDGSGKADAHYTGHPEDVVWGVVFHIAHTERGTLDAAEGLGHGYVEKLVNVLDQKERAFPVHMYAAEDSAIDAHLWPYTWYKRFVVEGAREHGLPVSYVAWLEAMPAIADPDPTRAAQALAVIEGKANS